MQGRLYRWAKVKAEGHRNFKKKNRVWEEYIDKDTDINFPTCLFLLERQKLFKSQGEINLQLLKT